MKINGTYICVLESRGVLIGIIGPNQLNARKAIVAEIKTRFKDKWLYVSIDRMSLEPKSVFTEVSIKEVTEHLQMDKQSLKRFIESCQNT